MLRARFFQDLDFLILYRCCARDFVRILIFSYYIGFARAYFFRILIFSYYIGVVRAILSESLFLVIIYVLCARFVQDLDF